MKKTMPILLQSGNATGMVPVLTIPVGG